MSEIKNSGIDFRGITLENLTYTTNIKNRENRDIQIEYGTKFDIAPTGKQLVVHLTVMVNKKKVDTAPFVLDASIVGLFEQQGEEASLKMEEFAKVNALAIMFPFVRELVFNVTCRSIHFPPLVITPVNLSNLAETKVAP